MTNLYRLVYTSFRKPECTDEEIDKILQACKKNNPAIDMTGVLLHSDKRFIQYIEGDKAQVESLFEHIKTDDRHASVNQRAFDPIDERLFPSWEMGYKDLSSGKLNLETNSSAETKASFDKLFDQNELSDDYGLRLLKIFDRVN